MTILIKLVDAFYCRIPLRLERDSFCLLLEAATRRRFFRLIFQYSSYKINNRVKTDEIISFYQE